MSGSIWIPNLADLCGEDLIFVHIREDQVILAIMVSLSYVIDGLSLIRMYARVFLGPHSKSIYDMAYRSS